jgi:hypothetical protein
MKKTVYALLATMLLIGMTAGCNLNASQQPTDIVFPTPNLTMTALFAPVDKPVNTEPAPVVVTPTSGTVNTEAPKPTVAQPTLALPTKAEPTKAQPTLAVVTNTPILPTATVIKPTNTTPPTATPKPVVTIYGTFLTNAPIIDGDWAEWPGTQYPMDKIVYGGANWSGEADLEASFQIGWDATYLYIASKVHDDKYVQNASGENIFKGDSQEILILNGSTIYQIGWTAGGQVGDSFQSYRWFPSSKAGVLSNLKTGAKQSEGLYKVEVAIPWSDLDITPANGATYRFAISVSDNDDTTANKQQTMMSNSPDRILVDAYSWGYLVLKK